MEIPPRSLNETENDCLRRCRGSAPDARRLLLRHEERAKKVAVCWSECSVTLVVTSQNARHITEENTKRKFFDGLFDLKSDPTAAGSQQVITQQE